MLKLFKPRKSCAELGYFFASTMPKLLVGTENLGVEREFQLMVECGASAGRIRPEMTALHCFMSWAGMAVALQKREITEKQFVALETTFLETLRLLSQGFETELTGSASYDSFWQWLQARLQRYTTITHSSTDPARATELVVQNFWDFAGDGFPSEVLRQKIKQTYESGLLNAAKIVSSYRLVVD